MRDAISLTLAEVLAFHEVLIEEFGGSDVVRDLGVLESAFFRPGTGHHLAPVAFAAARPRALRSVVVPSEWWRSVVMVSRKSRRRTSVRPGS